MRHVDDGTLHAWLDGQVGDPVEVARIGDHLRECAACSAQLEDEQAAMEQAEALLSSVAPAADASRAAFEMLVARARTDESSSRGTNVHSRTWVYAAGWAASVSLAVGLGWAARDLWSDGNDRREETRIAEAAREQTTVPAPVTASSSEPAPVPASPPVPSASTAPERRDNADSRSLSRLLRDGKQESAAVAPARTEAPATPASSQEASFTLGGVLGESESGGARANLTSAAPPPAPAAAPPPPPPAAFQAQGQGQGQGQGQQQAAREQESVAEPQAVARAAAPAPGGAGGGGGLGGGPAGGRPGGAGGGRGGGGGGGGRGGGGRAAAPAVESAGQAGAAANLSQAPEWRSVARTEAAARSGMALYGLNGLTPVSTMLSADSLTVRTIYRIESGETVELTQQRAADQRDAITDTSTSVTATAPTVDVQNARQAQAPAPTQAPAPASAVWSQTRGDVRLTLRGTVNVDAVAQRLRVD